MITTLMISLKRIGMTASAFVILTSSTITAFAEIPSNAIVAETKEQVALLGARLHELLLESSLDQRGVWLNSVEPVRRAQLVEQVNHLAPDKRDRFYDSEFTRALAAFGDVRTKPFCVFGLPTPSEPMLYGDHRYALSSGLFPSSPLRDSARQPGQFGQVGDSAPVPINVTAQYELRGRTYDGRFDPARMNGGYESIVAAQKKLGEAARFRTCFRYVRLENHPEWANRGVPPKWLVLEWLGGDLVDNRNGSAVLNIPVSWAAQ